MPGEDEAAFIKHCRERKKATTKADFINESIIRLKESALRKRDNNTKNIPKIINILRDAVRLFNERLK